jgi:hypothetical protein
LIVIVVNRLGDIEPWLPSFDPSKDAEIASFLGTLAMTFAR